MGLVRICLEEGGTGHKSLGSVERLVRPFALGWRIGKNSYGRGAARIVQDYQWEWEGLSKIICGSGQDCPRLSVGMGRIFQDYLWEWAGLSKISRIGE